MASITKVEFSTSLEQFLVLEVSRVELNVLDEEFAKKLHIGIKTSHHLAQAVNRNGSKVQQIFKMYLHLNQANIMVQKDILTINCNLLLFCLPI